MRVVATAGHVDHGKSTLVRALTGTDPDRLAEERRRGLTIELGFCWTDLADGQQVAFVDVPGHERFVTTALAGLGPVPAALLVVAADDGPMPQTTEHVAALDALGVRHGVVAVTRSDLADPGAAAELTREELAGTGLADSPVVPVCAPTGEGLPDLRRALARVLAGLPEPDAGADVRLWVDRCFTVTGAGTVVTGTLPAGTVTAGDLLQTWTGHRVRVRRLESLGRQVERAGGVARVALNLTGDPGALQGLRRGDVLLTPGAWPRATELDVLLRPPGRSGAPPARLPREAVLHLGAASCPVRVRRLGVGDPVLARLRPARPLPLRAGDVALLRNPGDRSVLGVRVLDPDPPELRRRGAGRARAEELTTLLADPADPTPHLARRGVASASGLRRLLGPAATGPPQDALVVGDWWVDGEHAARLRSRLAGLVDRFEQERAVEGGLPVAQAATQLGVPDTALVHALLPEGVRVRAGRLTRGGGTGLSPVLEQALDRLVAELAEHPFQAPPAGRLRELGLADRTLAAAAREGRLLRLAPDVVLPAGADDEAAHLLAPLPAPFTASQARQALGTSRRVVLPLLDHLDRTGRTRRLPDDRRELR